MPEQSEDFALSPAPAPKPAAADWLQDWSKVYGKSVRQLRRWIAEGEIKGDQCPIADPPKMASWWSRVMKHRCPLCLIQIGNEYAQKNSLNDTTPPVGGGAAVSAVESPIGDISEFSLEDGEAVRQAKQMVAVAFRKLKDAHEGRGGDITILSRRHAEALKSLQGVQSMEDAQAKRRGDLVDRATIQRDVEAAIEMLRMASKSMGRRVLELLPGIPPDLSTRILGAIEKARENETAVFRRLPSLKAIDDVRQLLDS